MGSISTHRAKGFTNDEWFRQEVFGDHQHILASATIKSCYYAAVRDTTTGEVFAAVIPFTRSPRGYHNFCWKTMDETCGPSYYDAPAKVLDLLTDTTNEYAREWRAECRKSLKLKGRVLESGAVVRLSQPLTFWVGGTKVKATEFTYAPQPRRKDVFSVHAEELDARILVRLPDWRRYSFETVTA